MNLDDILLDRNQGSAELLRQAVDWLTAHPETLAIDQADATVRQLRERRPAMAGFSILASRLEDAWRQQPDRDPVELLTEVRQKIEDTERVVVEQAGDLLKRSAPSSVVTLSFSTTVLAALEQAREYVTELHVLESLPGGEGRQLAELAGAFLEQVRVYDDHDMEEAVNRAGFGLIGADTVYRDGAVLNKVLSSDLAAQLLEQGKPLYVLATSWKWAMASSIETPTPIEGLFELVAPERITRIIADGGELPA